MLEVAALRQAALTEFAALTPHKDRSAQLADQFGFTLDQPDDSEYCDVALTFAGKRATDFTFPQADMELSLQEFTEKHLKRAAQALLDSK